MLTSGKYPQSTDKTTEIKRVAQPTRNLLEAELSLELCSLSLSRCGFLFGSLQHVADSRGKFGDGGTSINKASGNGALLAHVLKEKEKPL